MQLATAETGHLFRVHFFRGVLGPGQSPRGPRGLPVPAGAGRASGRMDTMADFEMADFELPTTEAGLRARQDELVRGLATENSAGGLAALSAELEAIQRRLEHLR